MERLSRKFFARDSAEVARCLLGKILVRDFEGDLLRGEIVETEAYYGETDPPSHASSGKTGRSMIMWGQSGRVYVYLIYGIHYMLNIVTESAGSPGAVLIRALVPIEGLERMSENRDGVDYDQLTDGPGKLTRAFGIGLEENGEDIVSSDKLWLESGKDYEDERITVSGRIGVSEGKNDPLRFFVADNPFVSR